MSNFGQKQQEAMEQHFSEHLSDTIITRGWDYYRSGQVKNVKFASDDTLYGTVIGSDVYAVVIDAGKFRYSTCTCPYGDYCKHMAAVFFAYLNEEDTTGFAAKAAYRRLMGLDPQAELTTAAALLNKPKPEAGHNSQPNEEASPAAWQNWMESEYGEVWRNCRHSLHALQPVLSALKGTSKHWDKPQQRLHWMNVILFVLEQGERAIKSVDTFSRYYHEMSFARMAEPWIEHYGQLALELHPSEMGEQERKWADHVVRFTYNRALKLEQQLFDWSFLYLTICEKLSENQLWREEELSALNAFAKDSNDDSNEPINRSFIHTASAMLHFFSGNDESALGHFEQTDFQRSQKMIYPCAAQRLGEQRWELFDRWMNFLHERIYPNRSGRTIGPFVALCRRADEDQPENEKWTAYMTELLPYSYSELSEHWLAVHKYEEWADLQLLLGMKPDELGIQDVKEVAKAAPAVMLPLYHQSIEDWINTRNRQGYRMAVKQLKKLERLYKADKDADTWNFYITGIAKKHQRLRAFQEELWKGKLVK
ncbi:SWIM zinc finger family protein [Paenibacillus radicis (ex Gao et al. 2016)]|uniref:SWIM-type domain-containing protein n=1 Tax=Paenibacillus radicis (ex Gao et al. 2016) TaxID=1737354 RepID=A0A917GN51_9BACL|nr:SWIM zinc finger family protein [Paenibacillus radicis (ex Gao et al. 2016)]GGG52279.1 hypothetical protein GCM10010918_01220 [Paenibacillus radicis (ex Gao et al. 2016)]